MARPNSQSKLSPRLASELQHLGPGKKLRVVVFLRLPGLGRGGGRRTGPAERRAAVEAVKESAGEALSTVDTILKRFDGRRLADGPDALGAVPVEATGPAIRALARSARVKAIVEDQSIHLIF